MGVEGESVRVWVTGKHGDCAETASIPRDEDLITTVSVSLARDTTLTAQEGVDKGTVVSLD